MAHMADNSGTSRYFSLHTDGIYLQKAPEMVVLHCIDPGTSEIPTVFVDTRDIINVLQASGRLDEAKDYELVFRNKEGIDYVRPLLEMSPKSGEPVMNIALASPKCHLRPNVNGSRAQAEVDLKRLQEEQADTAHRVKSWYEIATDTFEKLTNASEKFKAGDLGSKKDILLAIGEHPVLMNGQLQIQHHEWLIPVRKNAKRIRSELEKVRTEPQQIQKASEEALRTQWCRV